MATTYEPIATTTLGSTASSYTFSSIPGTYTDLILTIAGYQSGGSGDFVGFQFNNDTSTTYSNTYFGGNGSTTFTGRASNYTNSRFGALYPTGQANIICHIQNYSNTVTDKAAISRSNSPGDNAVAFVNLWRSTSAISTIKILIEANNFQSGTTFTLYGIKAA